MSLLDNRAFNFGDAVKAYFYISNCRLIMAEESYFFLMSSMRKMRMQIPMTFTLDYFENLFSPHALAVQDQAVITLLVYRETYSDLVKAGVNYEFSIEPLNILALQRSVELDLIKEINVNANLLSQLQVHCSENIYAAIYAQENDLDDVILLNPSKRIARASMGNLLFLKENKIQIPKQSEGAYISPLMENLVTYIHKNGLAEIEEAEMIAFETQKAEEILLVSDAKGLFPVAKIRSKQFDNVRFRAIVDAWQQSFANA